MTTAAPPTPAGGRLTEWVATLVVVAYVAVLVWIAIGRPPIRAALLRAAMTSSQAIARGVGAFGLHAEAAYRRHVSPDGAS